MSKWSFHGKPLLTKEDYQELSPLALAGDIDARNKIAESNLGLIYTHAGVRRGMGIDSDDLLAAGALGVLEAASRYDPNKEGAAGFAHYASYWIRLHMDREILDRSLTVRLPVNKHGTMRRFKKAADRLYVETGRTLSVREYMAATDHRIDKVTNVEHCVAAADFTEQVASLNAPVGIEGDYSIIEFVPDPKWEQAERDLEARSVAEYLMPLAEIVLDKRELDVVLSRLDGEKLEDIGNRYEITRERARQIEAKAMWKMCRKLISRHEIDSLAVEAGISPERVERIREVVKKQLGKGFQNTSWPGSISCD